MEEVVRIQFRASLTRPIQMSGADRRAVIGSLFISAYVAFITTVGFGIWVGAPVGVFLWALGTFLAYRAGKADPFFLDILWRNMWYRNYYPAKGRFTAVQRNYREW